ncbi:MAG: hypothetical protein KC414_14130 [Romboutsia sp.]|nr:hypothetical protein [Romboutsia sp.]
MNTSSAIIISILVFVILGLILFYYWVSKLNAPTPGVNCHKDGSGWLWNSTCTGFEELTPDPTLLDPIGELYLVNFNNVNGAGPPLCKPIWYRYRYVNVKTGGYSTFSNWSSSPVFSGSSNLPCVNGPGNCDSVKQGSDTCQFNAPTVGVPSLQYNPKQPIGTSSGDTSFVYANVHRYVGNEGDLTPPSDSASDEVIGYLYPSSAFSGISYVWQDVLSNPCIGTCNSVCNGC